MLGSLLALPLAVGCAGRNAADDAAQIPSAQADRGELSPARIYSVGEQRFAEGKYAEAIELWRHSVRRLPQSPDADHLRHQLILRIAYGQLMAWDAYDNTVFLQDAQQMLGRYLERHESLFGETDQALAERGEVYEILWEVERRLDPSLDGDDGDDGDGGDGDQDEKNDDGGDGDALAAAEPTAGAAAQATPSEDPAASVAGPKDRRRARARRRRDRERYASDGSILREVVVKKDRPSVDDPETRAKLLSRFGDAETGLYLTKGGLMPLHGPRPLLRAGGLARPVEDEGIAVRKRARKLGSTLLATARPALKSCYAQAFARNPAPLAQSTVEVSIDAEGTVRQANIVDGGLVDILGDLCLVDELEGTQLKLAAAEPLRIRVPMTFFYQGAVNINEGNGRNGPAGIINLIMMTLLGASDNPEMPGPAASPESATRTGGVGA